MLVVAGEQKDNQELQDLEETVAVEQAVMVLQLLQQEQLILVAVVGVPATAVMLILPEVPADQE
jgi:hypothetical protein